MQRFLKSILVSLFVIAGIVSCHSKPLQHSDADKKAVATGSSYVLSDSASSFCVAADGSDNNNGSLNQPFRTIERAKEAVKQLVSKGLSSDVHVYIREGTYYLREPLVFGPADSGTDTCTVIYEAYPGENPVISGGRQIVGNWTSIGNDKYTITIPEVVGSKWWFRQLWCDDVRCERARWPKQPCKITGVSSDLKTITLSQSAPGQNFAGNRTELVVYHYWTHSRGLAIAKPSANQATTQTVCGAIKGQYAEPEPGKLAYLEHNVDFVTEPGEWHLNPSTGLLTYKAAPGVNPNTSIFIAPRLGKLIELSSVRAIVFKGLSFAHTGWDYSNGFVEVQAGIYTNETGKPSYAVLPVIQFYKASTCRLERCNVAHIATTAVGIGEGCFYCTVTGCDFSDIGGGGIMSGWPSTCSSEEMINWPDDAAPRGNGTNISNNYFHEIVREWFGCVGLFDSWCKNTHIINNTLKNLPYTGISIGWNWNTNPYAQDGVVVQHNHIFEVMQKLVDGGGIYTNGNQGTVLGGLVSDNLIHDVRAGWRTYYEWQNVGIYPDVGCNIRIQNNITYNTAGPELRYGIEKNMMVANNSWNSPPQTWDAREKAIAAAAGVAPGMPSLTISKSGDGNNIVVSGSCEAWARLASARIIENGRDVKSLLQVKSNGAIYGLIPLHSIREPSVTLEVTTTGPDGNISPKGISNPLLIK